MIRKFLDLSTGHLSPATHRWMREQGKITASMVTGTDPSPAFLMGPMPYGWFCWAGMEDDADNLGALPKDLRKCIRHAKSSGCDYILFDADASIVAELPTYDHDRKAGR
ncbi:hypothetical protein ACJ4V0_15765 [Phreatobacter sp. HK31-P]